MTEANLGPEEPTEGWSEPRPARIPDRTYTPLVFGLGVTLVAWGLLASYIVSLLGGVLIFVSLWGWIGRMTHGT